MLAARVEQKNGTEVSRKSERVRGASRPAGEDALLRPGQAGQAGAVPVDGVSSAVELALVMANAEWGVRRRTPARIGGGRQGGACTTIDRPAGRPCHASFRALREQSHVR